MTAGATTTEHEAKFDVDEHYDPPDLRPLIGRTRRLAEQRLLTIYYDTPDRRLWQRGINLRYRTGEGGEATGKWTLKLPGSDQDAFLHRDELTWPGDAGTIPEEARTIVRGLVRRAVVGEVVRLDTRRRRLALHGPGSGKAWGELDDDLVTVIGGPNDGLRFRQVELELMSGHPPEAESVLDSLRESGANPSTRGKLDVALGAPQPARHDGGPQARRRETLADTTRRSIQANLGRLLDHDYRLRRDAQRPDAHDIHQARVATRRLRSDLQTFGSTLDPVWLGHTTAELRWIGTLLGRVRDADVLTAHVDGGIDPATVTDDGVAALMQRLSAQRSRAARELSAALASERYINLLDKLHAATDATPFVHGVAARRKGGVWEPDSRSAAALPAFVDARWRRLKRKVRKGGSHPSDRDLHQMRIAAKRLRYAAETATPVIGKPAKRTAMAAERIQTSLGDFHDAVVAEQWLRTQVEDMALTPGAAFAAGTLYREQQLRQQQLRHQWQSDWKQLRRGQNRSWF